MAKLTRVPAKVFAASAAADEIGQFGSAVAGSKLETSDVATIQGLSAWLDGWSEALASGNRYPALQEMNGLLKVLSYQGAYALQEGIPEYDVDTTYYIGSIVKKTGTFEIYGSLTNDNVGNTLTVDTEWEFLCDLNEVADIDLSNLTATGKSIVSTLPMPSTSYITLTAGASDSTYVAPANGYLSASSNTGSVRLANVTRNYSVNGIVIDGLTGGNAIIRLEKNDTANYSYNTTISSLYFYYDEGSKP